MEISKDMIEKMKAEQTRKFWSEEEMETLKKLVENGIVSPAVIHKYGFLTGRSKNALSIKIAQIRGNK